MSTDHNGTLIDKGRLFRIFEYMNERPKENQLNLDITVYRGSLMTLPYDGRPATKGIDCVFGETNPVLLDNILESTRRAFDFSPGWLNEEVKEPLVHLLKEDIETYRLYSNLSILKPKKEQLLAMKMLAARPYPAMDFEDAFLLTKDLGIRAKQELLQLVSMYVPISLLGERQLRFIEYLGEDLGYDWK